MNAKNKRQVNAHEVDSSVSEDEYYDIDTPVEYIICKSERGSCNPHQAHQAIPQKPQGLRPVRLNLLTWRVIGNNSKKNWDLISEKDKLTILLCAANHPE